MLNNIIKMMKSEVGVYLVYTVITLLSIMFYVRVIVGLDLITTALVGFIVSVIAILTKMENEED